MSEYHAVGTVINIVRKQTGPKAKRPGVPFFVVTFNLQSGGQLEATSWSGDFAKPEMQDRLIEFTYSQTQNQWGDNNRIERWSFQAGNAAVPPAQTHSFVAPPSVPLNTTFPPESGTTSTLTRDEQIVRQSSLSYASALVGAMAASDSLPWGKSGKGSTARKDPDVWLELTFTLAKKIRDRVLEGDWTVPFETTLDGEPADEQEPPDYVVE
jgi:hypothetical protein